MSHQTSRRASCQAEVQRRRPRASDFPIGNLLSPQDVEEAVAASGCSFRERLFTPLMTVWIFLGQVLDPDHSCRQAVLRFKGWLSALGRQRCSANSGAYCKARKRLPEAVLTHLTRRTGRRLEERSPHDWHWHGRRVRVGDGSTVSMPDSQANQAAYPQSRSQKRGLGFPIARIFVLFSLSVGTVLEAAMNPYQGKETGETAMLRSLLPALARGDLVLGDRYFANYWIIALASGRGIDVVFRQHQSRKIDFRRGRRLGKDDHLITWAKPRRPKWMARALYEALPATLTLREVRLRIPKGKKRTREIVVVSTLLDAGHYPKGELQGLYRLRWQAELNLQCLKTVMQMDILRGQTPQMVRKEVWAHFLVYNLIRTAMAQAAETHQRRPWKISFKGALQTLSAFGGLWPTGRPVDPDAYDEDFLEAIAEQHVGQRPDRCEPRARKRRPKSYPLLTEPREQARSRVTSGTAR